MIKFRVYDLENREMWATNDYEDLSELFMALDTDDSMFSNPMQSTGMFDKNGVEVFIGDIVKCTVGCPHEVYLEKEYGGNFIGGMPAIYLKGIDDGYAWTGDEEVIGNIYQNPDLLESVEE